MTMIPLGVLAEPISSLSHLLGALGVLLLLPSWMSRVGPDWRRRLAYGAFALSAMGMLAVSGTYHGFPEDTAERALLRRMDHAAIFTLIAGTYTPVLADFYRGAWRRAGLVTAWVLALGGAIAKTWFFDAIPAWLGLAWYLALGWAGLVGGLFLARRVGVWPLLPLMWGGVAYSVGALMDGLNWPLLVPGVLGPHELFHAGVLAGLGIHAWLLSRYAVRFRAVGWDGPAPTRQS